MLGKYRTTYLLKKYFLRVVAIIGSVLLFAGGPDYYSPRSLKHLWDIGHIVFFYAFATLILLDWSQNKKMSFSRQCIAIVLIALILGILIELVQAGTTRTTDLLDVTRNLLGTFVAISFSPQAYITLQKSYQRTFQTLTVGMVIFAIIPFAKAAADEWLAQKQLPVLSDFETPFEIDRWSGNSERSIEDEVYFHGKSSMKVVLNTSEYSGTSLKYFPGNWLNYRYLHLNIFNPGKEPLKIAFRIHDRRHTRGDQAYDDRFNKNYVLLNGWNQIEIRLEQVENAPKERKLDLGNVQELGIFAHRLPHPRVIFIDRVSLERIQTLSRSQVRLPKSFPVLSLV